MLINKIIKPVALFLAAAVIPVMLLGSRTGSFVSTVRADEASDSIAIISSALNSGAHRCNVEAPRNGNVFVRLTGTFDTTTKEAILDQINGYRLEACRNGYPDPRNRGRSLTMADYVPIKWSRGLEEMAMLRAAEASLTLHHLRLTGEDCWNSSYDVASSGEILAWGGTVPSGISIWYAERSAWVRGNGSAGHYSQMIDPSNTYFAVSGFNRTQAGEFSKQSSLDETKIDVSAYNSQLAEIGASYVSDITASCENGTCYPGGHTTLYATGTISAAGYSERRSYTGIRILPTTWSSGTPGILTTDGAGNAAGISAGTAAVYCKIGGVTYGSSIRVIDVSLAQGFASRLYSEALMRNPDQTGLDYWTGRLVRREITGTQCAYGFFFSSEFLNSNLSNDEYIRRLYRTFLGRDPEAAGFAYWQQRLTGGASRLDVFYGFSNSVEFARICADAGITP